MKMKDFSLVNGIMKHFPAPSWSPKVLYMGFSFTHLHCILTAAMQGVVYPHWQQMEFSVLPKHILACGLLETGFKPPTPQLSVCKPLYQLSHRDLRQQSDRILKTEEFQLTLLLPCRLL